MKNKNNGITLIALIVTIVVLIIIAGVTLNIALGENGIFTKAKQAADTYKNAAANEVAELDKVFGELEGLTGDVYIPEGFSHLAGSIDTGYVIKNDTTDDEFVWIPVDTPVAASDAELATLNAAGKYPMAVKTSGQDANGRDNYRGVLYDFDINASGNAVKVTARSYSADSGYREPANLTGVHEDSPSSIGTGYVFDSQEMFTYQNIGIYSSTMYQEEYNELVESVIANKGFYVGRYESGNLGSTAVSKLGATGINNQTWYQMYKAQKNIYGNVEGKKTHMIWGSQYDQVLIYLKDVPNTSSNVTNGKPFYVLNSVDMGVYSNNEDIYWDSKSGKFEVKGIYDLAGNVGDLTMETYNSTGRGNRGRISYEHYTSSRESWFCRTGRY